MHDSQFLHGMYRILQCAIAFPLLHSRPQLCIRFLHAYEIAEVELQTHACTVHLTSTVCAGMRWLMHVSACTLSWTQWHCEMRMLDRLSIYRKHSTYHNYILCKKSPDKTILLSSNYVCKMASYSQIEALNSNQLNAAHSNTRPNTITHAEAQRHSGGLCPGSRCAVCHAQNLSRARGIPACLPRVYPGGRARWPADCGSHPLPVQWDADRCGGKPL